MREAQARQLFAVLLLQRGEERAADAGDGGCVTLCALDQIREAIRGNAAGVGGEHVVERDSRGARLDEERGIDRWLERWERAQLAVDVLAVPDLEEAILDACPQLIERRRGRDTEHGVDLPYDAELQRGRRSGVRQLSAPRRLLERALSFRAGRVERHREALLVARLRPYRRLAFGQHVVCTVNERCDGRVVARLHAALAALRHRERLRAEEISRDHIEQRRLADRLAREARELAVAPVDQVFDVPQEDGLLIRRRPQTRDRVWVERILRIGLERVVVLELRTQSLLGQTAEAGVPPHSVAERAHAIFAGRVDRVVRGRIEEEVEPPARRFEAALAREVGRDQERNVEEDLPPVRRERACIVVQIGERSIVDEVRHARAARGLAQARLMLGVEEAFDTALEEDAAKIVRQRRVETVHDVRPIVATCGSEEQQGAVHVGDRADVIARDDVELGVEGDGDQRDGRAARAASGGELDGWRRGLGPAIGARLGVSGRGSGQHIDCVRVRPEHG